MSFKKGDKKHHIQNVFFYAGYNGQGPNALSEPVPKFMGRPGDGTITANGYSPGMVDNNTIIIFGRDRNPFKRTKEGVKEKPGNTPTSIETVSGYSDHMGAGAIDIIVGRGAPFPTPGVGNYPNSLPPLYLTRQDTAITSELSDESLHPQYMMDAARIYISQMTDIDDYFDLKEVKHPPIESYPHSAIMLKADRVRLHSRRDIKIVAGGDKWELPGAPKDSNGFTIGEKSGIHLIAGNGTYGDQQPIPVGDNLVLCLEKIILQIDMLTERLNSFMKTQKEVNAAVAGHWHGTGAGGTTMNPIVKAKCTDSEIDILADMTLLMYQKTMGIMNLEKDFLFNGGKFHINSLYNTTT